MYLDKKSLNLTFIIVIPLNNTDEDVQISLSVRRDESYITPQHRRTLRHKQMSKTGRQLTVCLYTSYPTTSESGKADVSGGMGRARCS